MKRPKPMALTIPRLIRCPWCGSARVWSYAHGEYRCEACTREWFGSACAAVTQAGQCLICGSPILRPEEMICGCNVCSADPSATTEPKKP